MKFRKEMTEFFTDAITYFSVVFSALSFGALIVFAALQIKRVALLLTYLVREYASTF